MLGKLTVKPVSAQLLKEKDTIGFMDPYVTMMLDSQVFQTVPAVEMGQSPVWNESFTFNVSKPSKLKIRVKDKDFKKDDFLGKAKIPLMDVCKQAGPHDGLYDLHSKILGRNVGTISLRFEWFPQDKAYVVPPQSGYVVPPQQGQTYIPPHQGQTIMPPQEGGYVGTHHTGMGSGTHHGMEHGTHRTAMGSDTHHGTGADLQPGVYGQTGYTGAQTGYTGTQTGYTGTQTGYTGAQTGYTGTQTGYQNQGMGVGTHQEGLHEHHQVGHHDHHVQANPKMGSHDYQGQVGQGKDYVVTKKEEIFIEEKDKNKRF